jgi:hypothetical protein
VNHELLGLLYMLPVAGMMLAFGLYCARQEDRARAKEDEEFYRQIYGPAGKPKKPATAEPESPTRSAE